MAGVDRSSKNFKYIKIMASAITMSNGKLEPSAMITPKRAGSTRASATLQKMGYMPEITEKVSTDRLAFEMLHAIGYTVEVGQQNLTLVDNSPNKLEEISLNYTTPDMNILEQNLNIMQSFPNECDPIYQMDDNLPDSMQQVGNFIPLQTAQTLDLVGTGYVFGALGLSQTPVGQTSRYFNNKDVSTALKRIKR